MKRIIILLFIILATKENSVFAQQYPLFTNYITNSFGFNPAVAGINDWTDLRFMYRTQWVQVNQAPKTMLASFNTKLKKNPFGLGAYFYNDGAGELKRTGASLALSFTQKLAENTKLSLGASAGYYQLKLSNNYRVFDTAPDQTILNAETGKWIPDFNIGLYLQSKGLFAGFSVPQIFERSISYSDSVQLKTALKRHYYGMLGYNFKLTEKMSLEPSVLLKMYPNAPFQYDASLRLYLNPNFWLAGSWRKEDAIAAMVGFNFGKLSLAYAYDVTTSNLNTTSSGSHEITLGLRFGAEPDRDKDGIPDKEDKCPDCPGVKENAGCPKDDRDQDCILDNEDKCPDCPGVKENAGCPKDDRDQDCVLDNDDKCPDCPGVKENAGCPKDDRDQDCVVDDEDECPDEKGTVKNNGCPEGGSTKDTDKDGVPDREDQCPNIPGLRENKGCPFGDRDNDGIRDDVDKCPDVAGTLENLGCPLGDRDRDGILDNIDPCPDEPGPISNQGCPPGKGPMALSSGDRDGDGVVDSADKCPNTAGPLENAGCPYVAEKAKTALELAIRNIYFDYNKAEIRKESFKYLDNLANWMVEHPEYNLYLGGHTDSRGTEEYNMELSKNRVYAVMYYLADRGVAQKRVRVEHFGESHPIATNINEQGRQENRRVEMKWEFE